MRVLGFLLLVAIGAAAGFVYDIKYRTTRLAREAQVLEQQIAREKDTIAALRAEWSELNQPARLQALAARFLPQYKNLSVTQMAFAHELPERPIDLAKFIGKLPQQELPAASAPETAMAAADLPQPPARPHIVQASAPARAKTRPFVASARMPVASPLQLMPASD